MKVFLLNLILCFIGLTTELRSQERPASQLLIIFPDRQSALGHIRAWQIEGEKPITTRLAPSWIYKYGADESAITVRWSKRGDRNCRPGQSGSGICTEFSGQFGGSSGQDLGRSVVRLAKEPYEALPLAALSRLNRSEDKNSPNGFLAFSRYSSREWDTLYRTDMKQMTWEARETLKGDDIRLSFAPVSKVLGGNDVWRSLEQETVQKTRFACIRGGSICHTLTRVGYPGIKDNEIIIAACRQFVFNIGGTQSFGLPHDCRPVAFDITTFGRHILVLSEIWADRMPGEPIGGGFTAELRIASDVPGVLKQARDVRNLFAASLNAIGLEIKTGPSTPMMVASSPSGVLDRSRNAYRWTEISIVYSDSEGGPGSYFTDFDAEKKTWLVSYGITIHESIRNNLNEQTLKEDAIPAVEVQLRNSLIAALRAQGRCGSIENDFGEGARTLICRAK